MWCVMCICMVYVWVCAHMYLMCVCVSGVYVGVGVGCVSRSGHWSRTLAGWQQPKHTGSAPLREPQPLQLWVRGGGQLHFWASWGAFYCLSPGRMWWLTPDYWAGGPPHSNLFHLYCLAP